MVKALKSTVIVLAHGQQFDIRSLLLVSVLLVHYTLKDTLSSMIRLSSQQRQFGSVQVLSSFVFG